MRSQISGDFSGYGSPADFNAVMPGRPSRRLLGGLFTFLYLPITYHYGWRLLSNNSVDFPTYYYAARRAFVEWDSPYGFSAFDAISAELGRQVHPYLYPPPSLLAFWPLAKLSSPIAHAAFLTASHLCYLGSIWLILARLTPFPADRRLRNLTLAFALIYLLCFDPALATLGIGQVNLIALFFICLALAGLKRGAPSWRIALPLSVAILLKTYPALLLLLLFSRQEFWAIALTCIFYGIFAAVAALVLPHGVWGSWLVEVLPEGGYGNDQISAAAPWNQSINGFVTRLLLRNKFCTAPLAHPFLAKPVATVLALIVMGVTVLLSFRLSKRGDYHQRWDDEMAAYLLMIFLVAPLSWDHHLVYILPAAVLAISWVADGSTSRKAAFSVPLALFLIARKLPFDHPALMHGWRTLWISIKFYPVVILWLFFIGRLLWPKPAPARR